MRTYDVIIIGSGLAGMTLALHLAETRHVALVTKRQLLDGASSWAQGGIAGVLNTNDSIEAHVKDTLIAGAGLCSRDITEFVISESKNAIQWLIEEGVPFSKDDADPNEFHLTREGGHSQRRIIHAEDATGAAVQQTLVKKVRSHPNIEVMENHIAIDLITGKKLGLNTNRCYGAYVLNKETGEILTLGAPDTVLSAGGTGKVYLYTTNPDIATGDGVAMGWRAGCRVANMEFIQFHPTCLYHPHAKSFLISEAVRGEGGLLKLPNGHRFMPDHDERAELAPRDIVARAIDYEMKKRGVDCVYLDITHKSPDFLKAHFPNIYQYCLKFGIDITREPIPVVPAAHYSCGGIMTNFSGQTDVAGLYAIGETAFTGLHGANRLASNSLLECIVFAQSASRNILSHNKDVIPPLPHWDASRVTDPDEEIIISHNWDELRRFMWDYVGIVRTKKRLERAQHRIKLLYQEINDYYTSFRVGSDLIELRNLVMTADLIVRCAMLRHESRGLHYSLDYPHTSPIAVNSVLTPD